jgi:hypothetical protein
MCHAKWSQLATGELEVLARQALVTIAQPVDMTSAVELDLGVSYLADRRGMDAPAQKELWWRAVRRLAKPTPLPVARMTVLRYASVVSELGRHLGLDAETPLRAFDTHLLDLLDDQTTPIAHDLLGGLSGAGEYFLRRPASDVSSRAIGAIVARLEGSAVESGSAVSWPTTGPTALGRVHSRRPYPHFDLGMAHGVPGVIAFLAKASRTPGGDRALPLLRRAAPWLRQQVDPDCRVPSWTAADTRSAPARLAWCYGELGVGVAILDAADALGDAALYADGVSMMARAAGRRSDTGVLDASLCHGCAGAAHIFNRVFQSTGAEICRDAAVYWLRRLILEHINDGEMKASSPPARAVSAGLPARNVDRSFLTGATGVLLALESALSNIEPAWDHPLLVDLPLRPCHDRASQSTRATVQ